MVRGVLWLMGKLEEIKIKLFLICNFRFNLFRLKMGRCGSCIELVVAQFFLPSAFW